MKRIFIIALILLLFALSCVGCGLSDKEAAEMDEKKLAELIEENGFWDDEEKCWWVKDGFLIEYLEHTDKYKTDIDDLTVLKSNKDISSGILTRLGKNISLATSSDYTICTIHMADFHNPIERIEVIDDEHVCAIYRVETHDGGKHYVYAIFKKQTEIRENVTYESWASWEHHKVGKTLSFKQLEDIEIENFYDLLTLDKDIAYTLGNQINNDDGTTTLVRYFTLEDGVAEYKFAFSENWTSYSDAKVTSKTFYPYNSAEVPEEIAILNAHPELIWGE